MIFCVQWSLWYSWNDWNYQEIQSTQNSPFSLFHVLGEDLPVKMSAPRMTTTENKNQLLMTYEKGIYSFHCRSSDDCYWERKTNELQISRGSHVMVKVPASMVEKCESFMSTKDSSFYFWGILPHPFDMTNISPLLC